MKTKEIGKTAFQSHGLAFVVNDNVCEVLLVNGKTAYITCKDRREACEVRSTLMYYPLNSEHSGIEFDFEVTVTIK